MDAAHFEKTLSSEVLFEGQVVTLTKDVALLENGETSIREVVHHHGGACIVPYFEDGTLCMVRQFRYAMQQELWELPAGKLEKDEHGADCFADAARRELKEETGAECGRLTFIGDFYSSPAVFDEVIHMYLAEELNMGEASPDEDEFLNLLSIPLDELCDMIARGDIADGKTQAAVLKVKYIIDKRSKCQ